MSPHCFRPHGSFLPSYSVNGCATILKPREEREADASGIALGALAWVLADGARAQRFLDLTGLTPDGLRGAIAEPATHRAVLDFLCAHEPDLVAAGEALDLTPQALAAARDRLAR